MAFLLHYFGRPVSLPNNFNTSAYLFCFALVFAHFFPLRLSILSLDDVENKIFNFFIFSPSFFFHSFFFLSFRISDFVQTEFDKKNHPMFILLFDKFQAGLCETCLRKAKKIKCTWKFPTRTIVITNLDEYTRQSIQTNAENPACVRLLSMTLYNFFQNMEDTKLLK